MEYNIGVKSYIATKELFVKLYLITRTDTPLEKIIEIVDKAEYFILQYNDTTKTYLYWVFTGKESNEFKDELFAVGGISIDFKG
jgi:hypothetical protein